MRREDVRRGEGGGHHTDICCALGTGEPREGGLDLNGLVPA